MFTKPRFLAETGAGTLLGLALVAALTTVFSVAIWLCANLRASAQLRAATESAALTGELTYIGGITGFPCENARRVFTLNMAFLEKCLIVSDEVVISSSWKPYGIELRAEATAAPVSRG